MSYQNPTEHLTKEKKTTPSSSLRETSFPVIKETRRTAVTKMLLFVTVLLIFAFIGLLFFARPSFSDREQRKLTSFPAFSLSSFFDGSFFKGVDTWYADTFPGRDVLIGVNQTMEQCYGFRTERLIGSGLNADDIPDPVSSEDASENLDEILDNLHSRESQESSEGGSDGTDAQIERINNLYLLGNAAYEIYGFHQENASTYAALIAKAAQLLDGQASVYDLIIPLAYSVNLSSEQQANIGASDCDKAISYMYSRMGSGVHTVSVFNTLLEHSDEYIFFRTDHHWTSLGAYYSYREFCREAGISPMNLSDYKKTRTFDNFLGTLYNEAGQPAALAKTPDTVIAYEPNATNDMTTTFSDGTTNSWYGVINNVSASNKYLTFIAGDNPLSVIHNPEKSDGSSILVVKESFGNAFVPFLVDSFEYVYVIDYRHYFKACTDALPAFVEKNHVQTVLFINTISATGSSARLSELDKFIRG